MVLVSVVAHRHKKHALLICLSVSLSICLSLCLRLSVSLSLPACPSVCLSLCLSFSLRQLVLHSNKHIGLRMLLLYLSICLSLSVSFCLHVLHRSKDTRKFSFSLSSSLSVSVFARVCLSAVFLSVSIPFPRR